MAGKDASWPESAGTGQNPPESVAEAEDSDGSKEGRVSGLRLNDAKVYKYLECVGEDKTGGIAASLSISSRTVRDVLARLQSAKLVERIGSGKNTVYRIMP